MKKKTMRTVVDIGDCRGPDGDITKPAEESDITCGNNKVVK